MAAAETFRRAGTADADAVTELTRAAYAKWVPVIGREPLPMRADHARAVAEHIVFVAEEGPELLGLVELIPATDHLLIENLAVRPDMQRRGLGMRLLDHAEDIARSLGLGELRLYTNAAFTENVRFYAGRGFQVYRRGTMVPGSTTVFMRKPVKA